MPLTVNITQFEGGSYGYQNTTAEGVSNYLIWLCGKFGLQAQNAISHTPINSAELVKPFTPACSQYQIINSGAPATFTTFSYVPCGQTEPITVNVPSGLPQTINALINSVRVVSGTGTINIVV